MSETLFTDGWTITDLDRGGTANVRLPHDAMIGKQRSADAPSSYHGAYFPGGRYRYQKRWDVSADAADARHRLRFEGVGGASTVRLNGRELTTVDSRYREFTVELDEWLEPGATNLIEVDVDDSAKPDSRWYTGSGIYRPVWLDTTGAVRFAPDGVRVFTTAVSDPATLRLEAVLDEDPGDARLGVVVRDGDRVVADVDKAADVASVEIAVPSPRLWSETDPHLYDIEVSLLRGADVLDTRSIRFGIRTISVDAQRGLRINGESVLLRGACIHHDSGVLGAATFRDFEFRRARILKENGYNAVRSAHNPLSRDMLDACDEVGIYVMDELTDVWAMSKTAHDAAERFEDLWPADLESMIAKDINHASVIMYSIGNEIADTATADGIEAAARMNAFVKRLDTTRPTTLAINFLVNLLASRGKSVHQLQQDGENTKKPSAATSTFANVIADKMGSITRLVSRLPAADKATRESLTSVDVAGYNYAWSRYRGDARRHPQRVVCGSETMPGDIARIWPLVERLPNVIGDFMWTGWDYLGETGLGAYAYGEEFVPLTKPYPYVTSGTGTIDITGHPGAQTLLARAVWGLLPGPGIAVRPLDLAGQRVRRTAWRSSDAVCSWAWRGYDGTPAEIEIYSADDEVEVLINGRSLGRRRAGRRRGFLARFTAPYEPGEIVAIGYRSGVETGRSTLRSADASTLVASAESDVLRADGHALAFINLELRDEHGTVEMTEDDSIRLEVTGPAELAGFGNGAFSNPLPYTADVHRTYYGRAFAVLRSTGMTGEVSVRAISENHGEATVRLRAHEQTPADSIHIGGMTGES